MPNGKVPPVRPNPVEILIGQGKTRIAELLPIRYARMKAMAGRQDPSGAGQRRVMRAER
jgi:hypothetical protein